VKRVNRKSNQTS